MNIIRDQTREHWRLCTLTSFVFLLHLYTQLRRLINCVSKLKCDLIGPNYFLLASFLIRIGELSDLKPSITQFLTNHGNFRSHLHKINKAPSPFCSCADNVLQTAEHLLQKCTLFLKDRPRAARNLPLHQILKQHINSVPIFKFMESIFRQLQDWSHNKFKHNNIVNLPWYTSWRNTGCTFIL